MKLVKCKRCDAPDLYWTQSISGRWTLMDQLNLPHFCSDGKIKAVKCKYCNADTLHWAEEIHPLTQIKKAVLTESYGLPHACDERLKTLAKKKQEKKDKYEQEKKRINAHADGMCPSCKGTGRDQFIDICQNCYGRRKFSANNRRAMLAYVRRRIWPNMIDSYNRKY